MIFLGDVGAFNNFLLLTLAYFLGAGASALFMRLFGGLAEKTLAKNPDTYWVKIDPSEKDADSYYRPF